MTDPHLDRSAPIIRLKLESRGGEDESVSASDFLKFVEAALSLLRKLERSESGASKATIDYRIVDLEFSSASIALQGAAPPLRVKYTVPVANKFAIGVAALRDKRLDASGMDPEIRSAFRDLASPLQRGLDATFEVDGAVVELRGGVGELLDLSPASESAAVGSLAGSIDALNVHNEHFFYLYPPAGPSKVKCVFDPQLLEQVRGSLKRYTTVHGLLEYVDHSPYPTRIVVERIERHPREAELPPLDSLWGSVPDITGGVDSVTFVRRMRDAE